MDEIGRIHPKPSCFPHTVISTHTIIYMSHHISVISKTEQQNYHYGNPYGRRGGAIVTHVLASSCICSILFLRFSFSSVTDARWFWSNWRDWSNNI